MVFLSTIPKIPLPWLTNPDLIGSYDVFVAYQREECENCRSNENVPIEGFVHLTSKLQDKIQHLKSDQDVADYLQRDLYLGLIKVCHLLLAIPGT